jgi:hypothetical protein
MSNLPEEAVKLMRQQILEDKQLVIELAQNAGLPMPEDLETEQQARAQMESAQEARLAALEAAVARALADAKSAIDAVAGIPDATTLKRGQTIFAGDGNATQGRAVQATDSRLSNSRPPTAHTHPISEVNGLSAALGIASVSLGTVAIPVLLGGGSTDVTITYTTPLVGTPVKPVFAILPTVAAVGNVTPTIKSFTLTGAVVTLKNDGIMALAVGGTLLVIGAAKA